MKKLDSSLTFFSLSCQSNVCLCKTVAYNLNSMASRKPNRFVGKQYMNNQIQNNKVQCYQSIYVQKPTPETESIQIVRIKLWKMFWNYNDFTNWYFHLIFTRIEPHCFVNMIGVRGCVSGVVHRTSKTSCLNCLMSVAVSLNPS